MLHGKIEVNGATIGEWWAVRKEQYFPEVPQGERLTGPFFWYDCGVRYYDMGGYPMEAEFRLKHRFGDGALRLAGRVIHQGYDKAKRVNLPRDEEVPDEFPV